MFKKAKDLIVEYKKAAGYKARNSTEYKCFPM
jgi:hypothetical protein